MPSCVYTRSSPSARSIRLMCTGRWASVMPYSDSATTVARRPAAASSSGASTASSAAAAAAACGEPGPKRCRS